MEPQTNQVTEVTKVLSKNQKNFIGLVLSATGIIFFLLSFMLFVAILMLVSFKFGTLITIISNGEILTSMMVGLLITGILSFGVGMGLQTK